LSAAPRSQHASQRARPGPAARAAHLELRSGLQRPQHGLLQLALPAGQLGLQQLRTAPALLQPRLRRGQRQAQLLALDGRLGHRRAPLLQLLRQELPVVQRLPVLSLRIAGAWGLSGL
jgi:hypothetical protein